MTGAVPQYLGGLGYNQARIDKMEGDSSMGQYEQMQQAACNSGMGIPVGNGTTIYPQFSYTTPDLYPSPVPPQRRKTMLENVKGYVEKHKDMLFTLGLVILVDHFLFKGALRERIKGTVEGALKKVEGAFHKEE